MKLPPDSHIARSKITHYLLVPQERGDKSRFLALTGYQVSLADRLIDDIRSQILTRDALATESTVHGQFFEIAGPLTGPNGRPLAIKTIWMKEHLSDHTKFITLIPDKSRETYP